VRIAGTSVDGSALQIFESLVVVVVVIVVAAVVGPQVVGLVWSCYFWTYVDRYIVSAYARLSKYYLLKYTGY
jgi:hypothetical protein